MMIGFASILVASQCALIAKLFRSRLQTNLDSGCLSEERWRCNDEAYTRRQWRLGSQLPLRSIMFALLTQEPTRHCCASSLLLSDTNLTRNQVTNQDKSLICKAVRAAGPVLHLTRLSNAASFRDKRSSNLARSAIASINLIATWMRNTVKSYS